VLEDFDQKLRGGEDLRIGAEIVVERSAIDDRIRASLVHEKLLQGDGRTDNVLGERFAGLGGTRGHAYGAVDRESRVRPLDHVLGQPLVQELTLQEERDDPLAEAGAHVGQIDGGHVDESAVRVEATFQEQPVPMGVPPSKLARGLEDEHGAGADALAGGRCGEVPHQPVDEAADLAVKPLVVAEEDPQYLWQGLCEVKLEELLG